MYREKYGRQTAAMMYQASKSTEDVIQMLLLEGANAEQAEELAQTYYQQHLHRATIANKKKLKEADMYKVIGLVFLVCGLLLSFLTYLLIDDGSSFILYYGLLFIGIIALIKSLFDKRSAENALKNS